MKTTTTILLSVLFLISTGNINNIFAQFPQFEYHEIGKTENELLGQTSLVDMDNDGDLDFIVGSSGESVWWFENNGKEKWPRHKIGDNCLTDKGGVTIDVDGDGNIDHIAGGTWYKNTGNPKVLFKRFENEGIFAYDQIAGDLDNDGKPEIVSLSEQDGIYIYSIPSKPTKKWKGKRIDDGVSGGIYPNGLASLDYDNDIDIIRSNVWYDNLKGDASKWLVHRTISFAVSEGKFANSTRVYAIDFDKDGDMDVIQCQANKPNGSIAWHENKDGKGINWYTHPIKSETGQDLHSLCVADFDNDGDVDVFSGGGPLTEDLYKKGYIWENTDTEGTKWEQHEILNNKEISTAVAGDIDDDGDIDIVATPWKGNVVFLLKNMLIKKE